MIADVQEFKPSVKFFDRDGKFNPLKILLIGKSGCGKSVILKDLLLQLRDQFEMGIVISATEMDGKPEYTRFIPRHFVFGMADVQKPGFFNTYFQFQRSIAEKKGIEKLKHIFLIMDDCVSEASWLKREDVKKLLFEGRHYKITLIIAVQYDKLVPPNLRNNFDFIILPRCANTKLMKCMNQEYVGMDDGQFMHVSNVIYSKDFRAMIIDNDSRSPTQKEQKITWFMGKNYPTNELKMCNPLYWRINDKFSNLGKSSCKKKKNIVELKKGEQVQIKIQDGEKK